MPEWGLLRKYYEKKGEFGVMSDPKITQRVNEKIIHQNLSKLNIEIKMNLTKPDMKKRRKNAEK
ncbi:hypothetical protein BST97_12100 [Nonlabens spongiae]|uniref:Uncharacterized protein n=1 Tax=Nonlabens spongiae TaxID=331648 RepID=A0A1W6MM72_9FLAO|nr:hypothetical protein BST97_12100 [Nonlabens spongiae]